MKRALIVLLLLAVAAGGLFAQVTYSGLVNSGFQVVIPNEGDTTFHWYSNDPGATFRFQFRAAYQNEDGTAGAAGSIRSNAGSWAFDGSNAWIKLLDKQLHMSVGSGSSVGGFGSLGAFGDANTAADGRLSLAFTPALDGTTFSVGLGINPGTSNPTNTFAKATYGAGLKFGLPGLLTAVVNGNYVPDTEVANANVGVQVAALNAASGASGLTNLAVDLRAPNVTDLSWIGIGPVIGFRVVGVGAGNLGATLSSRVFIPMGESTEDLDYWVGLDLGVPFTSAVDFNLNVGYEANATIGGPNADTGILGAANREGTGRAIGGSGDAGLIVRPQLTFKLGAAAITTGWSVQALLADEMFLQHAIYGYLNVGF
jgi:hypothetical protein